MNPNLLRAAIAARGLTQGQLAKAIGISENSMSRKIKGKREFTVSEADAICAVLYPTDPQHIFLIYRPKNATIVARRLNERPTYIPAPI